MVGRTAGPAPQGNGVDRAPLSAGSAALADEDVRLPAPRRASCTFRRPTTHRRLPEPRRATGLVQRGCPAFARACGSTGQRVCRPSSRTRRPSISTTPSTDGRPSPARSIAPRGFQRPAAEHPDPVGILTGQQEAMRMRVDTGQSLSPRVGEFLDDDQVGGVPGEPGEELVVVRVRILQIHRRHGECRPVAGDGWSIGRRPLDDRQRSSSPTMSTAIAAADAAPLPGEDQRHQQRGDRVLRAEMRKELEWPAERRKQCQQRRGAERERAPGMPAMWSSDCARLAMILRRPAGRRTRPAAQRDSSSSATTTPSTGTSTVRPTTG